MPTGNYALTDHCPERRIQLNDTHESGVLPSAIYQDRCLYFLNSQFIYDTALTKCSSIGATLYNLRESKQQLLVDEFTFIIKSLASTFPENRVNSFFWIRQENLTDLNNLVQKTKSKCPMISSKNTQCPLALFHGGPLFCRFSCDKSLVHTVCQIPLKTPDVSAPVARTKESAPVTSPSPLPATSTSSTTVKSLSTTPFTYRPPRLQTYPLSTDQSAVKPDDGIGLPVNIIPGEGTSDRTFATDHSTVSVNREESSTLTSFSTSSSTSSSPPSVTTVVSEQVSHTASPDLLILTGTASSTSSISTSARSPPRYEHDSRPFNYTCSGGFSLVDNRCYRLFIGSIEGEDVRVSCLRLSAKPAAIISSAVQRFFTSRIVDKTRPVFIGARLTRGPMSYGWLNGKNDLFRYTNWAPGEPNPLNGECVVMRQDGQWQSYQCNEKAQYTCE